VDIRHKPLATVDNASFGTFQAGIEAEGGPPVTDFAYRCRIKRISEIRDEAAAAVSAFWEERDKAAKAIPEGAPVA
jgi:hypothetical protein